MIELSFKKFIQSKDEVKLGFGGRFRNTKDLEFRRGSKARELRRQNTIKLLQEVFLVEVCS
jgi:hypothetical protein